jgi:hypothetical protein
LLIQKDNFYALKMPIPSTGTCKQGLFNGHYLEKSGYGYCKVTPTEDAYIFLGLKYGTKYGTVPVICC